MKKSFRADRLGLGVCYYPEQWDDALWSDDFARMHALGLSLIRVAEFAWTVFEPSEGQFSFDLFDRALDLAHRHGLQVVFGTPTATPPAWLTHRYPEVLNVSQEGTRYRHGQRRHYNYNAPVYHELSARIVTKLAEHYRGHPAIVGWQIDNEINCEVNVFYSQADHTAFRAWLRDRYGTLDRLNERWGAVFWNQTYTDWDQVHLTRPTVSNSPNPHQALDEKRFFSASAIRFVRMQAEIIRRLAPRHWITTNGLFGHLDSHRMTEEALDFISYDSYPNFAAIRAEEGPLPLHDRKWGWYLSMIRDISPRFVVMEQQSGPNGWVNRMAAPSPKPGQMRLWTYQSVAHGADAVLYFRWRTATKGTEIYWHGINDYHNQPNRRVAESRRIAEEFAALGAAVAGSEFQANVAILRDYDNEWDGEFDSWYGPLERSSAAAWYATLQYRHIPTDVVYLREATDVSDLRKYQALVYPHPAIMDDRIAAVLSAYVSEGGRLIVGCRAGYKDRAGHCGMRRPPGPLADLCGVEVEDFTLIGPRGTPPAITWAEGIAAPATTAAGFNDILAVTSPDAAVLARYGEDYYAGAPALVRNPRGAGAAYYYGAAFDAIVADLLIEH
ncbi:MAG: beta-galactosidase, partial [Chloroflexota bacterium]